MPTKCLISRDNVVIFNISYAAIHYVYYVETNTTTILLVLTPQLCIGKLLFQKLTPIIFHKIWLLLRQERNTKRNAKAHPKSARNILTNTSRLLVFSNTV